MNEAERDQIGFNRELTKLIDPRLEIVVEGKVLDEATTSRIRIAAKVLMGAMQAAQVFTYTPPADDEDETQ